MIVMVLLICMKKSERWHGSFKAMGTDVEIDLVSSVLSEHQIGQIMRDIEVFFEKMEHIFSRFRSESELCRVNEHVGSYVHVSPEFSIVAKTAIMYHEYTDHLFDPRVHDALIRSGYDRDFHAFDLNKNVAIRDDVVIKDEYGVLRDDIVIDHEQNMIMVKKKIDLSGIVKGWTVDHVRGLVDDRVCGYVIDAGGDMWVQGKDEHDQSWYIGIEGVADHELVLCVENEAIATSGTTRRQWTINGRRYHHLIDPVDVGQSSFDISTVTVIASSVTEADVLAKVLFLMERHKRELYIKKHDIKAIIIENDHNIYISQYAQKNIVQ